MKHFRNNDLTEWQLQERLVVAMVCHVECNETFSCNICFSWILRCTQNDGKGGLSC